jgi:hypothetical protein
VFSQFFADADVERQATLARWRPLDILTPWQTGLFLDKSTLRATSAGRRSGKTNEFATELIDACLSTPRTRCAYFAKTETDALELIWPDMEDLLHRYDLGARKIKSNVTFPNGSFIRITGAKDQYEAQRRFRGRGFDLVIGDECQLIPYLREMVQKAIRPATIRGGRKGRLMLGGTPGEVPGVGYWEEIRRGMHGEWSVHRANIRDNPHIVEVDKELAEAASELGGPESSVFRREWLGEDNVPPDEGSGLVYRYSRDANHADLLPGGVRPILDGEDRVMDLSQLAGAWQFGMSMDLGHTTDAAAILVLGVTNAAPGWAWLVEEYRFPKRPLLPKLAAEGWARYRLYRPSVFSCDEGALGVQTADNLRAPPYNLPITAADKLHPLATSDAVNAALTAPALRIHASSRLAQDLAILRWDPEEMAKGRRKMARQPHSDLEPPLRYLWPTFSAVVAAVKAPRPRLSPREIEVQQERQQVNRLRKMANRPRNRGLLR